VDHYNDLILYEEGLTQKLTKLMVYFHFGKMLVESLLIHRLAGRMRPLNRTLWQILYYWVGLGCIVGYTVYHPEYKPSFLISDLEGTQRRLFATVASVIFIAAEVLNFLCHWHFSTMEEKMAAAVIQGSQDKKIDLASRARKSYIVSSISKFAILKDHGFSLVTCADWMWELLVWVCISSIVQTMSAYVFLGIWFVWHNSKARERHWRYIAEY
jgi:hypothetical protein